jgi:uncharacterized protein (DUF1786 family)
MSDKRSEILLNSDEKGDCVISDGDGNVIAYDGDVQPIYLAMDENGRQMCMDLLEYMAKNNIQSTWYMGDDGERRYIFVYNREDLTKEQLFENFL